MSLEGTIKYYGIEDFINNLEKNIKASAYVEIKREGYVQLCEGMIAVLKIYDLLKNGNQTEQVIAHKVKEIILPLCEGGF